MRRTSAILSTSSVLALLTATPAMAQQPAPAPAPAPTPAPSDPATPPDPNVEAQTNPADPDQGAAQTDDPVQTTTGADEAATEDETIVVTGLRRSLQSAQNIKRNSRQQVDSIVAEDIGKLPDIAVSETAARIPGLQVIRRGGEADTVLVRGLPDFATTYNGREIFTAETRVVALQDFPAANIAALEVFKTTTSELVEAGLAGLVNVRSRRPFDFGGFQLAGSAWALRSKQSGKWNPNANFLITNRWEMGNGAQLGALLNVSYTELDYLDSEISNTDFLATPDTNGPDVEGGVIRFPDIQRIFYRSGNRVRPSVNASVQYRPTDDIEIYAEGLYQGFRNKVSDRLWEQFLFGATYTDLDFRGGTNLVSGGTANNTAGAQGFQGGTFNKTDTYQFAIGGSWETGPLKLTTDIARTRSRFKGSTESVDYRTVGGITVNFDNERPEFDLVNFDPSDPANYFFRGLYEEAQVSKGDDWQFRLDGVYESPIEFLPEILAGVRYSDRDAHREFGNRYAQFNNQAIPYTDLPLNFGLFRSGFRGTDVQSGFTNWLAPSYGSIRDNREELREFVMGLPPGNFGFVNDVCCSTVGVYSEDAVDPNPRSTYDANEKSTAGYIQARYQFGDIVDGVVGMRAVRTKTSISGTSRVETTPGVFDFLPVEGSNSYTDWLPNASLRWHITPEVQLRLSATQTRTRPTFEQLNPSFNIGTPGGICTPGGDPFACARVGGGGNPNLRPFDSDNYDASLEYYFSRAGFAAVALFRRDLEGFIQTSQSRVIDPELGPIIINQPFNTNKGKIKGAEAQVSTFFDWNWLPEWARSFGAQANVTYLDTKIQDPDPVIGNRRIYGVSKWTYNLVGMYERGGLSARLSYNKRGRALGSADPRDPAGVQNRGDDIYRQFQRPAGRLDLSTNYTFKDNYTVFFDWTNILGNPHREDFSSARAGEPRAEYVRFLRYEETILSGGIRFRFQ